MSNAIRILLFISLTSFNPRAHFVEKSPGPEWCKTNNTTHICYKPTPPRKLSPTVEKWLQEGRDVYAASIRTG
jgi:hypothetical protein